MNKTLLLLIFFNLFLSCKTDLITESEKKEIIAELDAIKTIDQKYAGIPPKELTEKYGGEKAWEIFENKRDSIGVINQKKIKKLYNKYGYLGYNKLGEKASQDFWITIQHADNDIEFQQQMLKELKKEISNNNASRVEYAMLETQISSPPSLKAAFKYPHTTSPL